MLSAYGVQEEERQVGPGEKSNLPASEERRKKNKKEHSMGRKEKKKSKYKDREMDR